MVAYLFAVLLIGGLSSVQSNRIIGGVETSIEEYPFIVQLEAFTSPLGWSQTCGASILTSYWVLSAAHCFEEWEVSPKRIRAGTTYRNHGGTMHYPRFTFNHPQYRVASRYDADVSVMRVTSPFVYSLYIQPGTIVPQGYQVPDNTPVVLAGWGDTAWGGNPATGLKKVEIYTINNELCRLRYQDLPGNLVVTPNMMCAGILDVGGRDACQHDGGGPVLVGKIIVGVISWGHRCANATYPGISTAVSSYTDWIVQTARG
ncbi:unnamed protein product [Leptosia nina]|uniref:Peptidase S1 domain-containing protein n=1 Tax=Leptosia nina TaxID=320188 RepID=A0AAV1J9C6_9NEOP